MEDYGPPFYNTDALYGGDEENEDLKKRLTTAKIFAIITMGLIALIAFTIVGYFVYHYKDMTDYVHNQTVQVKK